jgi:hypothetical protein
LKISLIGDTGLRKIAEREVLRNPYNKSADFHLTPKAQRIFIIFLVLFLIIIPFDLCIWSNGAKYANPLSGQTVEIWALSRFHARDQERYITPLAYWVGCSVTVLSIGAALLTILITSRVRKPKLPEDETQPK